MENRERNIQLIVRVNEKEKALFEEKWKLAKCKNINLFIRKCVLEKEIYQVDLQAFREIQGLLFRYASSVNQIAKRVNSTGVIYSDDSIDFNLIAN